MASFTGFGVIGEWFKESAAFLKVALVPKLPPKPTDAKEVLEKWLGFQFQVMVIAQIIYVAWLIFTAASGQALFDGIYNAVYFCVHAFVNSWVFWFSFVKREPACCCFIQGFKYQHLIVGIYFVVYGALGLIYSLLAIVDLMGTIDAAFFIYAAFVAVQAVQVIGMIGSGLCMVKIGGKAAGVEIPDVVGKAEGA